MYVEESGPASLSWEHCKRTRPGSKEAKADPGTSLVSLEVTHSRLFESRPHTHLDTLLQQVKQASLGGCLAPEVSEQIPVDIEGPGWMLKFLPFSSRPPLPRALQYVPLRVTR